MPDKVAVQELDPSTQEFISSHYHDPFKFARYGDVGYTMRVSYKEDADNFRNMAIRADDVWVVAFPRSGTTWTQELVWMLMNDLDYDTASKIPLKDRYLFLEKKHISPPEALKNKLEEQWNYPTFDAIVNAPSPRFIKTHMPFSLLPPRLLDTTKVVYVARDPRDAAVSFYHLTQLINKNFKENLKSYWNLFINDLGPWGIVRRMLAALSRCIAMLIRCAWKPPALRSPVTSTKHFAISVDNLCALGPHGARVSTPKAVYSPFLTHVKEAWALRHHPNLFFIFYEEMKADLPSCIKRIADFLGKEITNEQVMKLSEHLDIKQFKKNESVNPSWRNQFASETEGFVRKGVSGGWREHFDEEMTAQAQRWLSENLADTDLRFPDASSKVAN